MTRQELFTWIRQQYGTEPEYLWHDWNAVLRHNDNNKWYGVVLEVSADKLELPEAGIIDVLNVKSDPLLIGSLRGQDGYFPAYCRHNSIIVFEDTRGHVQTKCKACGRETVFNVLEMRRLRRLQLYYSSLNG